MEITRQIVTKSDKIYTGKNPVEFITVHETANTSKGANAQAHANLQSKGNVRNASWHYTVDDHSIFQSFEDYVQCWHAGDGKGPGNTKSVAIEICVNEDGDFVQAVKNAAWLVAKLLKDHPGADVVQHNHWSGKNCPAQLRSGSHSITWNGFVAEAHGVINVDNPIVTPPATPPAQDATKRTPTRLPNLSRGSVNWLVGVWQAIIGAGVDNSFGPKTEAATRLWQARNGLRNDASVGPLTWTQALLADANSYLARGDSGPHVKVLQYILQVDVDGSFGPLTDAATRQMQRFLNIADDGSVGPQTVASLRAWW